MRQLSTDILVHHVFPHLPLRDLLSLRQVSEFLKTTIDANEWDRRYFQDFYLDPVRLTGSGISRYAKRYLAKPRHIGYLNEEGKPISHGTHAKALKYFEKRPIVDLDVFELEIGPEEYDYGVAVRTVDRLTEIYTDYGVYARLDEAHLHDVHIFEDELVAIKGSTPMKFNLTKAFWEDGLDENYEPVRRSRVSDNVLMEEDFQSTAAMCDNAFKQLAARETTAAGSRLYTASPSSKYLAYKKLYSENYVNLQPIVQSLNEKLPGRAETLWFRVLDRPSYMIAGSCGRTLCIVSGGANYKNPRCYEFHNEIVKVEGIYYYFDAKPVCDINVLDCKGTLYCLRFTGTLESGRDFIFPTESIEPRVEMENVADLTETCALSKNGTIRCFSGLLQRWCDIGITGAVLVTEFAYITVN